MPTRSLNRDDLVATSVRLPPELHSQLTEAAAERAVSANHLMVLAVRDLLDRLIPVEELRLTR